MKILNAHLPIVISACDSMTFNGFRRVACAAGNFGIVTADREGSMCSFTPYFDMWRLRLLDVKPSKVREKFL